MQNLPMQNVGVIIVLIFVTLYVRAAKVFSTSPRPLQRSRPSRIDIAAFTVTKSVPTYSATRLKTMGRNEKGFSGKKEKIYSVRKKLDEFLEEDKKRRDRNLYILERFEKMRSTVAILKSINNNKVINNDNNVHNLVWRNNDRLFKRQEAVNYRETHIDDNNILREINERYILIPRIYSFNKYPLIGVKQSDDVDWRSKYNILDEIKRKEQLEPPERDTTKCFVQKDITSRENSNIINNNNNMGIDTVQFIGKGKHDTNGSSKNTDMSTSKYEVCDKSNTSYPISDWKAENKIIEDLNVEKGNNPIHDNNILKTVTKSKNEQINSSKKNFIPNDSVEQDNFYKELKDHNITNKDYDTTVTVPGEIQNIISEEKKKSELENNCEDNINNATQALELKTTQDLKVNEDDNNLRPCETEQEPVYPEDSYQNVDSHQVYEDDAPEERIYENDNYINDHHDYYDETQLQKEQYEPHNNASHEIQETAHNQHEQEYENSHKNQLNNDHDSQDFHNYESQDNYYPTENQDYDYQNTEQQQSEHNVPGNNILPENTGNTTNFAENPQEHDLQGNSNMEHISIDQNQQQLLYEDQNYIETIHDENQSPYVINNQNPSENNIGDNLREHTTNEGKAYDNQQEYDAPNYGENVQQFEEQVYSSEQIDNLPQDYNNQNHNELYQENQDNEEVAYDYATQNHEYQQPDGSEYVDVNQGEFVQYTGSNGFQAQSEIGGFQEDYNNQNIQETYGEETLQGQEIHDNIQYDYTVPNNEVPINDVNSQDKS